MIQSGKRYLITTNNWFIAPDGEQYRAVWGRCTVAKIEDTLGFTPLRPSTNWYISVGAEGCEVIVAGCQLHYAVRCEERPKDKHEGETYKDEHGVLQLVGRVWFAER